MDLIEGKVKISGASIADEGVWIRSGTTILNSTVDENVFIGFKSEISFAKIERSVEIATGVKIVGTAEKPIRIEEFSWIGARSKISAGIIVGKGSVVAAGSRVLNDVPDYTIVAGVPAKLLKPRLLFRDGPPQFRELLLKVKSNYKVNPPDFSKDYLNLTDKMFENVEIGNGTILQGKRMDEFLNGGLVIESGAFVGRDCVFESSGGISIGVETVIGNGVTMVSISHDYSKLSLPTIVNEICLGDSVKIGDGCIVLPGASLPDGMSVPANSIVLRDKVMEGII